MRASEPIQLFRQNRGGSKEGETSLIGSYEIAAGKLTEEKGMEATSGSRGIAIGLHFGGVFCDWDLRERGSMLKLSSWQCGHEVNENIAY